MFRLLLRHESFVSDTKHNVKQFYVYRNRFMYHIGGPFAGKPAPTGRVHPPWHDAIPVGAGLPAKRPAEKAQKKAPDHAGAEKAAE
ncbi:protein of unknown function [Pseudomonas sp. JV551A1]|nr:protein of unknown function [Pseudomonas sp. JV551A1]